MREILMGLSIMQFMSAILLMIFGEYFIENWLLKAIFSLLLAIFFQLVYMNVDNYLKK